MSDLPGWAKASYDQVLHQLQEARLSHAILIDEPIGAGGAILVQHLVRELLELPAFTDCREVIEPCLKWIDVDVIRERQGSRRRTLIIDVETIRDVIDFLMRTMGTRNYKVVVLDDAHLMNVQASNAFLKILEEPPDNSVVFLISTQATELLPTIRSRCATIKIRAPTEIETKEWLLSQSCKENDIERYLLDFGPAPLSILSAYRDSALTVRDCLLDVLRDGGKVHEIAAKMAAEDPASILTRWQRSVVRFARNLPQQLPIHEYYEELTDLKRQLSESPALNWQLQFESMLLKWKRLNRQVR